MDSVLKIRQAKSDALTIVNLKVPEALTIWPYPKHGLFPQTRKMRTLARWLLLFALLVVNMSTFFFSYGQDQLDRNNQ